MPSYRIYETRDADAMAGARDGTSVPGAGTHYGKKMKPSPEGLLGFMLETTGTITGTFTLWWTDKDVPNEANDDDWDQETTFAPTNPAGAATKEKYSISGVQARWCRIKLVATAGSGTVKGNQGAR